MKPPQHPRKSEFLALYQRTGWTQAELARKLELTAGGVSGLVKGETIPSAGLVKLLNLVMLHESPKPSAPASRRPRRPAAAWTAPWTVRWWCSPRYGPRSGRCC